MKSVHSIFNSIQITFQFEDPRVNWRTRQNNKINFKKWIKQKEHNNEL